MADIWFEGDYGASVDGDVLGDLHLRHLPAMATILIGGRLGDHVEPCSSCSSAFGSCESVDNLDEDSPRDVIDSGDPDYGRILLRDDYSLSGQIIINSDAELTPGDGWEGLVQIGEESPISLQPGNLDPKYAPYYTALSSELGGGAVGLVPFELHGADCIPSVGIDGVPEFLNSAWIAGPGNPGVNEIRLRHYGPVFAGAQPLVIELLPTPTQADPDPDPVDLTDQFTIQLTAQDSTLGPREVRISQNGMKPIGLFRVTPLQLFCASTTAIDVPATYPYTYLFRMLGDCNSNGIDDATELSPTTDANGDGILDECQTGVCDCNLAPPIDPANPGADVDVGDLLAYLDLWFALDPAAERTDDSPIHIDVFDLLDYLDCWFPHNGGVC